MSQFFYADKGSREKAFAFDNVDSDSNDTLVHPMPAVQGNGQKVDMAAQGRVGGDESVSYDGTPFGGDTNTKSHIQTPSQPGDRAMPGEAEDPRC